MFANKEHNLSDYDKPLVIKKKSDPAPIEPKEMGKRFNKGKPRPTLFPANTYEEVLKVLEFGASKYGDFNWKKGLKYTVILDSMKRHILELMKGIDKDPESGLSHSAHVICNAIFLLYFQLTNRSELDDREKEQGMSLKLEPGKYYKTRDGRKAFVGLKIPTVPSPYPFVGYITNVGTSWTESGAIVRNQERPGDLIEEWKEPEVYEFEANWKGYFQDDETILVFPAVENMKPLKALIGKRTTVRIEVKGD